MRSEGAQASTHVGFVRKSAHVVASVILIFVSTCLRAGQRENVAKIQLNFPERYQELLDQEKMERDAER